MNKVLFVPMDVLAPLSLQSGPLNPYTIYIHDGKCSANLCGITPTICVCPPTNQKIVNITSSFHFRQLRILSTPLPHNCAPSFFMLP